MDDEQVFLGQSLWLAGRGPQNLTLAPDTVGVYFRDGDECGAVTVGGYTAVVRPGPPPDGIGPDLGPILERMMRVQSMPGHPPDDPVAACLAQLLRRCFVDVAALVAEVGARREGG